MKQRELLFVACEGPTGRKERRAQASANRHVQYNRTIRSKRYNSAHHPNEPRPVIKKEEDSKPDPRQLDRYQEIVIDDDFAGIITTPSIIVQPAGFDPFDCLSTPHGSDADTQQLLATCPYGGKLSGDDDPSSLLLTATWEGFWRMAMESPTFYHHLLAALNVPARADAQPQPHFLCWPGNRDKFMYHKSMALEHLRTTIDQGTQDVNMHTVILSMDFQLSFAVGEGNRKEASVHAKALERAAKADIVRTMRPWAYLTHVVLVIKYSQWSLDPPPAEYSMHPYYSFEHIYTEAPGICAEAREKASSALSKLPAPRLKEFDTATIYSFLFRMFLHQAASEANHGFPTILGITYDTMYDLCTYAATVRKLLFEGRGRQERSLEALYCVILAANLSTFAISNEYVDKKGQNSTNTTARLLAEICASLKRQSETVAYWRTHASLDALACVLFFACAHWRFSEKADMYKPQGYMFCLFRRVIKQLSIKSGAELREVLRLFPWTEIWCEPMLYEVCKIMGFGQDWILGQNTPSLPRTPPTTPAGSDDWLVDTSYLRDFSEPRE